MRIKLLAGLMALAMLAGCADTIKKVVEEDQKVTAQILLAKEAFWIDKDCKAGIAQGILDVGTISRETQMIYAKLVAVGDAESEDFKKCYGTTVYYYALYFTGRDVGTTAAGNIMKVLTPMTGIALPW